MIGGTAMVMPTIGEGGQNTSTAGGNRPKLAKKKPWADRTDQPPIKNKEETDPAALKKYNVRPNVEDRRETYIPSVAPNLRLVMSPEMTISSH